MQMTHFTCLISVLSAPLEMSPCSLQFYVEHHTQVSVYLFLFLCVEQPFAIAS